jgi:hypothetical protein
MLFIQQDDALRNPPPVNVKPKELSPEEKAQRRKQTLAASFEKEYREREERRERESKEAQARGATLADFRRPAPANMEVLEKIYSVLK